MITKVVAEVEYCTNVVLVTQRSQVINTLLTYAPVNYSGYRDAIVNIPLTSHLNCNSIMVKGLVIDMVF